MSAEMSGAADLPLSGAIDVHHHVIPEFYVRELRELGVESTLPEVARPRWTIDASLAMMDRLGIRAAVVNLWPGVPVVGEAVAASFARRVNENLAELVATVPGRFGAFAVVPLPHVDAAVKELAHAVDVLGLDGVGLVTNYRGEYLGSPAHDRFFAEAHERGTPLFLHPTAPPSTGQQPSGLPASLCEFPFETVRVVAQLLYGGVLKRYPGLRLILAHGGGGTAYYANRLVSGQLINPELGARLPADPLASLRRLYSDTAMAGDRHAFPAIRSFASPSRLLVGSDFPFMPERFIADNNRYVVVEGGFTPSELARVESGNAIELFPRFADNPEEHPYAR